MKTPLLLVDDHPLFREGLTAVLSACSDLEVAHASGEPDEALDWLRKNPVDVVVLDVLLPSRTGISLLSQLLDVRACKVLALSVLDEPAMIAAMLRAGARGYALKLQEPQEIVEAIRCVSRGERYLPPSVPVQDILARVADRGDTPLHRLTQREREIFEMLIRGRSNDEVATQLFISRRTVETHRQRIMKKLATHSLVEMIRLAARLGVLQE